MTLSGAYLAFVCLMVLLLSSISIAVIILNASMNRDWTTRSTAAYPAAAPVDVIRFTPASCPPAASTQRSDVECTPDGLRTATSPCCQASLILCSQIWARCTEGAFGWRDWCPACWKPYRVVLRQAAGQWDARWTAVTG